MKYKEGDKVKIKIWEDMKEEFIMTTSGHICIHKHSNYTQQMEYIIRELDADRVITILEVVEDVKTEKYEIPYYKIEEDNQKWCWTDEMIECVEVECVPIENRFEIMDL